MSTPTAPGWYPDPEDQDQLRYFDGIIWSSHTTPRSTPPAPARPEPTSAVPTGWGEPASAAQQPGWGEQQQQNPWSAPPPGGVPGWSAPRKDVLPDGAVLAEWWRRLLAKIIDWIVVGLVGALLSFGFFDDLVTATRAYIDATVAGAQSGTTPDTSAFQAALLEASVPITLISLAVTVVYDVLFLVWRGATPGKMLLGTVVRPAGHPGAVSLGMAVRRQAILVVTNLVGLVPLVGILGTMLSVIDPAWLLWDQRRQTLHDKVADTVVVMRAS